MIGLGMQLQDNAEFNRRAMIALRAVSFGDRGNAKAIVDACHGRLQRGQTLTAEMQKTIFNICHQHRQQISDQLVLDYALMKVKGCD